MVGNRHPEAAKDRWGWLKRLGSLLGSILITGFIYLIFWGINQGENTKIEEENRQVRADVLSETDSLSDLENEYESGEATARFGNIELGEIAFETVSANSVRLHLELVNHGHRTEEVECAVKMGSTDTLRKVHTEIYSVPSGAKQFVEIIEVADAESEFLEGFVECLAHE